MCRHLHLLFAILILSCLSVSQATALPFRSDLNNGNDLYQKGKYSQSQEMYEKQANSFQARFNAGDALYKQGKYKESRRMFESLTKEGTTKDIRQKSFYNMGNSFFKQEDYKSAINAYEQALRLNSKDKDAQFNLSLAKKMLTMPRQKQKQKEQKKKEEKKDNQQQQPGPKAGEMSKEDAMRILKALEDKEEHKAQKVRAGKEKANDKDW